jgi:hypothetical protein
MKVIASDVTLMPVRELEEGPGINARDSLVFLRLIEFFFRSSFLLVRPGRPYELFSVHAFRTRP